MRHVPAQEVLVRLHVLIAQDLQLPGHHVDVNIHPTKREVAFLFQDEIINQLCSAAEKLLLGSNTQ